MLFYHIGSLGCGAFIGCAGWRQDLVWKIVFKPKLSFVGIPACIFIAGLCFETQGYMGIILCGIGYIPFAIILRFVPSFTGFALFTVSALVILCLSIAKGWFGNDKKIDLLLVFIPVVIAIIAAIVYIMQNPYFSSRFLVAVYPYFNRYGAGYAYCFIRDLLANSKFAGKEPYLLNLEVMFP